jgi:hypothetical protein
MDGRIKPIEFYVDNCNNSTLNEHNEKNYDEVINDTKGWGEDGTSTKLINITTTINDTATTKIDVDGQEQLPRYYMEEPISLSIIEDTRTKGTLDYIINLCAPTNPSEWEFASFFKNSNSNLPSKFVVPFAFTCKKNM